MPYSPLVSKIRVHNPNKKGSSSANRNYVTYIATREGVSLEQLEDINELLMSDDMLRRDLNENIIYGDADNEQYLRYIAKRPRSHGLFGNINTDDLKQISSDIAKLTKSGRIIYRGVISLGEKDGEALGFRNANAWNNYLMTVMPGVAEKLGINTTDYTWVAAFHAEEKHPHVHYMLWDNRDSVKSPFIHKATQQEIRIFLEEQMFDNEYERAVREVIYEECREEIDAMNSLRNTERAHLVETASRMIDEIRYVPGVEYERLPQRPPKEYLEKLADQVEKFIMMLPEKGSLDYQYLPPETKQQMDKIVSILLERPDMQAAMQNYLECVERVNQMTGKTQTKIASMKEKAEQDLRKRVANRVVKELKPVLRKEAEIRLYAENQLEEPDSPNTDEAAERKKKYYDLPKAVSYLEASAEQGNEYAQYRLGMIYGDEGNEEYYDLPRSVSYLKPSAEQRNQYAQYRLGVFYGDEGNEEYYDLPKSVSYLESSAEQGNQFAQYRLGVLYGDKGNEKYCDLPKAVSYLEASAEQGNEYAQYRLGVLYGDEGNEKYYDLLKSVSYLESSAEQGNQFAQYRLGVLYGDKGNEKYYDLPKAVNYLEASAEQGNQYAQYRLGIIYLDAKSEYTDIVRALEFLRKSAEQGNQFAQYQLGKIYNNHESGYYNEDVAVEYFKLSASQGNSYAQYELGKIYADDKSKYYNISAAEKYLTASAEQGNQYAQYRLGYMYFFGKNVLRDETIGRYWLERAAAQGNEPAQAVLLGQSISVDFSYCLLKGALSSLEGLNRQAEYESNEYLNRSHSRQARREKYLHKDNLKKVTEELPF